MVTARQCPELIDPSRSLLGEAQEKLGDMKAARAAWAKVIEIEPDSKQSADLRTKLAKN